MSLMADIQHQVLDPGHSAWDRPSSQQSGERQRFPDEERRTGKKPPSGEFDLRNPARERLDLDFRWNRKIDEWKRRFNFIPAAYKTLSTS